VFSRVHVLFVLLVVFSDALLRFRVHYVHLGINLYVRFVDEGFVLAFALRVGAGEILVTVFVVVHVNVISLLHEVSGILQLFAFVVPGDGVFRNRSLLCGEAVRTVRAFLQEFDGTRIAVVLGDLGNLRIDIDDHRFTGTEI
jgi:hypothetical protein